VFSGKCVWDILFLIDRVLEGEVSATCNRTLYGKVHDCSLESSSVILLFVGLTGRVRPVSLLATQYAIREVCLKKECLQTELETVI
jgi:hypothetical protein